MKGFISKNPGIILNEWKSNFVMNILLKIIVRGAVFNSILKKTFSLFTIVIAFNTWDSTDQQLCNNTNGGPGSWPPSWTRWWRWPLCPQSSPRKERPLWYGCVLGSSLLSLRSPPAAMHTSIKFKHAISSSSSRTPGIRRNKQ